MAQTQTVKVQHGCGCVSSLISLAALVAVVSWWDGLSGINRDGVVLGILSVAILGFATWYFTIGKRQIAAQQAAAQQIAPASVEAMQTALPDKKCPDCGELVKGEARICRFCRYEFR